MLFPGHGDYKALVLYDLHDALRRQPAGPVIRTTEPIAAVIAQSVRAAATVLRASRGWHNAKKVNRRKRHIAVDTTGLLLEVLATPGRDRPRDPAPGPPG